MKLTLLRYFPASERGIYAASAPSRPRASRLTRARQSIRTLKRHKCRAPHESVPSVAVLLIQLIVVCLFVGATPTHAAGLKNLVSFTQETKIRGGFVEVDGQLYFAFTPELGTSGYLGGISVYEFETVPALRVLRVGDTLRLSWLAAATEFRLESTATIDGGHWQAVTGPPATQGDTQFVELEILGGSGFFRL